MRDSIHDTFAERHDQELANEIDCCHEKRRSMGMAIQWVMREQKECNNQNINNASTIFDQSKKKIMDELHFSVWKRKFLVLLLFSVCCVRPVCIRLQSCSKILQENSLKAGLFISTFAFCPKKIKVFDNEIASLCLYSFAIQLPTEWSSERKHLLPFYRCSSFSLCVFLPLPTNKTA